MKGWLRALLARLPAGHQSVPEELWRATLVQFPFLSQLSAVELTRLRQLTREFLRHVVRSVA